MNIFMYAPRNWLSANYDRVYEKHGPIETSI